MHIKEPLTIAAMVAAAAAIAGLGAIAVMHTPWVYTTPSSWLPVAIIVAMILAPFVSSQLIAHYRKQYRLNS